MERNYIDERYALKREAREFNRKTVKKMAILDKYIDMENPPLTVQYELIGCVGTAMMTGKLEDFYSISTCTCLNPLCRARAKVKGSVCEKCYAEAHQLMYDGSAQKNEVNYYILNKYLIDERLWAAFELKAPLGLFRVEAFGDSATVTCSRNYIRMIRSHPYITFGVWTKNLKIWKDALELEGGKPNNMVLIYSSMFVNQEAQSPLLCIPGLVDHVFTVYDRDDVCYNCKKRCKDCKKCYSRDTEFHIRERLK